MTLSERGYLSIGEVLALLQEEFPDVTISKIRFLESQGLIEPERTPSGYRKFYGTDVERLRFILREQRENYLPLRVIRDRLDHGPGDDSDDTAPARATDLVADPEPASPTDVVEHVPVWMRKAPPGVSRVGDRDRLSHPSAAIGSAPPPLQLVTSLPAEPPKPAAPAAGVAEEPVQLTLDELAAMVGARIEDIRDLEKYGLVVARVVGRTPYYDNEAVHMARVAAGFLRHGIEARHLRMYKQAVERETALFEQVVAPLVRQRNPKARAQVADALLELADHGAALRALLVGQALRDLQP